jgi:hypothetical protein
MRTAIIVFHGIGQHQEFDTLESVAQALVDREGKPVDVPVQLVGTGDAAVAAATVLLGQDSVDLYEAYWSPWTKGKVGLATIFLFLLTAGMRGLDTILFRGARFRRFLFDQAEEFHLSIAAGGVLAFVMAFVVAIFALAAGMMWVAIGYGAAMLGLPVFDQCLLRDLRTWLYLLFLVSFLWMSCFGILAYFRREGTGRLMGALLTVVLAAYMLTTIAGLVPIGLSIQSHWANHESRPSPILTPRNCDADTLDTRLERVLTHSLGGTSLGHLLRPYSASDYAGWLLMTTIGSLMGLGYFFFIRERFAAYLGDVVAYLGAYRINEYYELREQIRRRCLMLARTVLDRETSLGVPYYSHIVMVGHSLGSVIAFDTLNALVRDDPDAAERISSFLTLGSPLDKAAFLFRTDQGTGLSVRTRLLSALQPLTSDRLLRERLPWVNFFSGFDPISGSLVFFDPPSLGPDWIGRVVNVHDRRSSIPVEAHTAYWQHHEVREVLWMMAQPGRFPAAEIRNKAKSYC